MKRRLPALVSHIACLGFGWGLCHFLLPGPASPSVSGDAHRVSRPPAGSAGQLLDSVLDPAKGEYPEFLARYHRLKASMTAPADFAAALDVAAKGWAQGHWLTPPPSAEIAALLYLWMEKDPKAAFAWCGRDTNDPCFQAFQRHFDTVFRDFIQTKGWEAGAVVLDGNGPFRSNAAGIIGPAFAREGDASAYSRLKEAAPPDVLTFLRMEFVVHWPERGREDLLKLAAAENSPEMLRVMGDKTLSVETIRWLEGIKQRTDLPEDFKKTLGHFSLWWGPAMKLLEIPFSERYEMMPEMPVKNTDMLVSMDVDHLLTSGRDWRYDLRHGQATVEQIRDAVFKELADTASAAPDELRRHLYFQLAEEDPHAARRVLEDLPAEDRDRLTLECARIAFKNVEPRLFLSALSDVASDSPELWEARLSAWRENADWNQKRLNEDYVEWVRALPPGLDREMGLFSLSKSVAMKQAELARALAAEVQDPKLRERLESSR